MQGSMRLPKRLFFFIALGLVCEISVSQDIYEASFQLPSNLTLRKCICQANQILQGSECVNQETWVPFYVIDVNRIEAIGTGNFSEVEVGDIKCPEGSFKVTLSQNENMILIIDGQLFWERETIMLSEYCLENVADGLQAQVCLKQPVVPSCCPSGYILGPGDSCIENPSLESFAPPVALNGLPLEATNISQDRVLEITCSALQVERRATLGTEEGRLEYSTKQVLLLYQVPSYDRLVEPEENYCVGIEKLSNGAIQYIAKYCYTDPKVEHHHTCKNVTCIRKCCPANYFLHQTHCFDYEKETLRPTFYEKQSLETAIEAPKDLFTVYGRPLCDSFFALKPHEIESDKSFLLRDGTLHVPKQKDFLPDSYCVDVTMEADGSFQEIALVCDEPNVECAWKAVLQTVLSSLSCVFLIATLAVYIGVADLRDRTNGRCLISMIAAMLAAYISLLVNNRETNPTDLQCLLRGFFGHFFGLAMFFWLNVMCFDMWSTLRSSQQQHQSKKTFFKYSIYAWGIPLIIAIMARIMDVIRPKDFILPNFLEHKTCWFAVSGNAEYWLYFSGIIFILLVVNLFFFIHVAVTLARKFQQRHSVFDGSNSRSSNTNKTKTQALLYVKLFIVMGVVWIADVISSIAHRNSCSNYWIAFDIINSLQGVFIFIVAVCNRDNMKKVRLSVRKYFVLYGNAV
ncbi:G-protein coupled receptor Mth-like isoform X2 [Palaemon carinicauda]|uniref:G-protein coupled receptor Mth-like isoform X2 n=1 Tax=Palaemon carinicauda TaxID=392227 RepID=UPI0035B5AE97